MLVYLNSLTTSLSQSLCEEKELFSRISRFLLDCDRHKNFASPEYICERQENIILTVQRIYEVLQVAVDCSENHALDLLYLVERLLTLGNELLTVDLSYWRERLQALDTSTSWNHVPPAIIRDTRKRGRPPFDTDPEQVLYLYELGFNWTDISKVLGVSRMTLYRKRREAGILDISR